MESTPSTYQGNIEKHIDELWGKEGMESEECSEYFRVLLWAMMNLSKQSFIANKYRIKAYNR